jgi:hypothetical protein
MTSADQLQTGAPKPETIRFPRAGGREPFTGLSRGFLYALASEGKIKTISLRERGKARGVRLIVYDSLIDYIRKAAEGGAEKAGA